jgi:hypothetical protein
MAMGKPSPGISCGFPSTAGQRRVAFAHTLVHTLPSRAASIEDTGALFGAAKNVSKAPLW